ncbi:MAG: hypothetical protein R3D89_05680 [Sphingomonadaceae bacterium]|jgi:hypothetical protein
MKLYRTIPLALAAALGACSPQPDRSPGNAADSGEGGEDAIACAIGGMSRYQATCGVERSLADGRLELTVRHPDGAFRRFVVLDDGHGLAVADGAHQAVTRYVDGHAEVAIENDRYRFPATTRRQTANP